MGLLHGMCDEIQADLLRGPAFCVDWFGQGFKFY